MVELRLCKASLFSLVLHVVLREAVSRSFTITNNCAYTVWPGVLSNAGVAPLSPTGFALQRGESRTITSLAAWGGRIWGRTQCSTDSAGKFSCATGDCGSGSLECNGNGASPPATLIEFTLDGYGGQDFYDVSLVDGYNLPVLVTPRGGSGQNCSITGCVADLNNACPSELKVTSTDGSGVACKSACEAFNQPQYCCVGEYASPSTCKSTSYSEIFKNLCPYAYSYAYDDGTSTFTCSSSPDYAITFCPPPNTSKKSSDSSVKTTPSSTGATLLDNAMVYTSSGHRNYSPAAATFLFGILLALVNSCRLSAQLGS